MQLRKVVKGRQCSPAAGPAHSPLRAPDLVQHEGVAHYYDFQRCRTARRQRYRAALQPARAHVAVVRPLDFVPGLHLAIPSATS